MTNEIEFTKYKVRGVGYHWDQIGKSITKRNIFVLARYQLVLDQIDNYEGKRILDVGCGDGALTYLISKNGGYVTGVDLSEEAINFAKEKTKQCGNIKFIKASAYDLPFESKSFDYVISSDAIEHLRDPEKMLSEMKRVYNGVGKVVITTPLRFTELPLDKMHIREFFESDFRDLLNQYFNQISIMATHPVVFMEIQNRHILFKLIFNLLNILLKINPFKISKGWRYYSILTAVIEETSQER